MRGIRISSLPGVATCPGLAVLLAARRDSGAAADTGSMVGRAIELWHRMGEPVHALPAFEQADAERAQKFPRAAVGEARSMFVGYVSDPRNSGGAVIANLCEAEVSYDLPPVPEDPTGKPIRLVGHVDQIRRGEDGQLYVWDVKSGKGSGMEMVYSHAWQLAAYALAATETLGEVVLPGGIIRVRAYETEAKRAEKRVTPTKSGKPRKVKEPAAFFYAPWSLDDCRVMMETVAFDIANLRRGLIPLRPGIACQWCPGGGPNNCPRKLDEVDVFNV